MRNCAFSTHLSMQRCLIWLLLCRGHLRKTKWRFCHIHSYIHLAVKLIIISLAPKYYWPRSQWLFSWHSKKWHSSIRFVVWQFQIYSDVMLNLHDCQKYCSCCCLLLLWFVYVSNIGYKRYRTKMLLQWRNLTKPVCLTKITCAFLKITGKFGWKNIT